MMLSFFAPQYIKEGRLVVKNARKLLHYKRDLIPQAGLADFEATIDRLEQAIKERDLKGVEEATQRLEKQWSKYMPPAEDAAWRENCEVFLVAIVIAIGVRVFFLQPFTIPTGSMEPTLNGIRGYPDKPVPNILTQAFQFVVLGRHYVDVVAKSDDVVEKIYETKFLHFFTVTDIQCSNNTYTVWAPFDTMRHDFHVGTLLGRELHPGDVIARGAVDTGDHVFVDKVSYNLHMPTRGEVFVFTTLGIKDIEEGNQQQGIYSSEYYIKRLAGLPGDTLRVANLQLFINGQLAQEYGFQRVMSQVNGYQGYSNPFPLDPPYNKPCLTTPDSTYTVPPHSYFAMGDNSFNSLDSRYWGPVPEQNLMGRGLFVYWPFSSHWGFVK